MAYIQLIDPNILPAHAGMILPTDSDINATMHITRTCGDDPQSQFEQEPYRYILPAHAGMMLTGTKFSVMNFKYYPHMRG